MDDYSNIVAATRSYESGENVIQDLKRLKNAANASDVDIEIAYELQSGTYVEHALSDINRWSEYGRDIARYLNPYLEGSQRLLDCGAGELTTLCSALNWTEHKPAEVTALDISWSRLKRGREFFAQHSKGNQSPLLVVGDMESLPFESNSFDTVLTVHALEPNGGREIELLKELLRVAAGHLILFEPNFERAGAEARERMSTHGYVTNLEQRLSELGAKIVQLTEFDKPQNRLNPTWVFVVESIHSRKDETRTRTENLFKCPLTSSPLYARDGWMSNDEYGIVYPILQEIPLLRKRNAILAKDFRR